MAGLRCEIHLAYLVDVEDWMRNVYVDNKLGKAFVDPSSSQPRLGIGFQAFDPVRKMRLPHAFPGEVARFEIPRGALLA